MTGVGIAGSALAAARASRAEKKEWHGEEIGLIKGDEILYKAVNKKITTLEIAIQGVERGEQAVRADEMGKFAKMLDYSMTERVGGTTLAQLSGDKIINMDPLLKRAEDLLRSLESEGPSHLTRPK